MIISLRGTSGAGKTHLVRSITELYEQHIDKMYDDGHKKKPYCTIHGRNPKGRCMVTPGHYQIKNGGIDTLESLDEAYRIARWASNQGHDVLMEGKNMGDGLTHVNALLKEKFKVRLVFIDEPLEICIASVRERGHTIQEKTIRNTQAKVGRIADKFEGEMFTGDRSMCFNKVKEWLGW